MKIGETVSSRVMVWVLNKVGIWPPAGSIAYKIVSIIFHLIFAYGYTMFLCLNLLFLADIDDLTDSLYMSMTCLALCGKLTNFRYFMPKIQDSLEQIKRFRLISQSEEDFMRAKVRFFDTILFGYYFVSNTAGFAAYTYVLFDNGAGGRVLPFHAWYPIDWRQSARNYWLLYAYQVGGMMCLCNLNITMDLYPSYVMYMISLKLEVLGKRLQNIGHYERQSTLLGVTNNETVNESNTLRECVIIHQNIIG